MSKKSVLLTLILVDGMGELVNGWWNLKSHH